MFGSSCILNENELRNLKGGLLVVGGGLVMLVGVGMLAAFGFGSSAAQRQLKKVGIGGGGSSSSSGTRAQEREDAALERHAERRGLATGAPTPAGQRIHTNEWDKPFTAEDETLPAPSTRATRSAERRPRAQATSSRSTRTGQPSRRPKRPHGRTTGLGPRARARRR